MKANKFYTRLAVVSVLLLMVAGSPFAPVAFALPGLAPDGPEAPTDADAATLMSDPIIVFEALDRMDGLGDPEILPALPPAPPPVPPVPPGDLNDPFLLGSVPDVSGAVGHTHYLQAVNKSLALYPKDNSGVPLDQQTFDTFWVGSGAATGTACDIQGAHHGQPYVIYDHPLRRWVVADVAYQDFNAGPYYVCIAVSTATPDYTGGVFIGPPGFNWWFYAFETADDMHISQYPDQLKLGLWPNGYYMSMDLIDIEHNGISRTSKGAQVVAFDRMGMISGTPKAPASFSLPERLGFEYLVPATMMGDGPDDPDDPNYFASIAEGKFYLWEFRVNWSTLVSTFGVTKPSGPFNPNYILNTETEEKWAIGSIVGQPESGEKVEAWGNRLTSPIVYRAVDNNYTDASLWASHSVLDDNLTALRWYELKFQVGTGLPYFAQTGTHHPPEDPNYRWLPGLSVDRRGNMAIGYNMSNTIYNPWLPNPLTVYPSIYYTGRLSSDAPGLLPEDEHLLDLPTALFPYGESQWDYWDSNPDGPWGRNSQMTVDPANDCVFWYTSMYYSTADETLFGTLPGVIWHTRVGAFSFPECRSGGISRVSLHTNNTEGNQASGLNLATIETSEWDRLMYSVDISGDGRYVVFNSDATTLIAGDTNNNRDVFVRDRDADVDGVFDEPGDVRTTRVPAFIPPSSTAQPNGDSGQVSISDSGRYIAFSSYSTNLVSGDTNNVPDIFLVDRDVNGNGVFDESVADVSIRRVSVTSSGAQASGGLSDQPHISGDGRFIVFRSEATNLVTPDVGGFTDIFLHDRDWDKDGIFDEPGFIRTVRISQDSADIQADDDSLFPTVSDDGRFVAFASIATNLGGGAFRDIYVRDRDVDADGIYDEAGFVLTQLISMVSGGGAAGDDESTTPHISNNGLYLVFASRANNLLVPPPPLPLFIAQQIYVSDLTVLAAPVHYLVSKSYSGLPANGDSYLPTISRGGTGIAFASNASNLDPFLPDSNGKKDIFLYDWAFAGDPSAGTPERISLDTNLGNPNDDSFAPEINTNDGAGRHIAFVSEAYDLVTNDRNYVDDVFAYNSEVSLPVFLRIVGNSTPVLPGAVVPVQVLYEANNREIDAITYAIDYDESCLTYLSTSLPSVSGMIFNPPVHDPADADGELKFSLHNWDLYSNAYLPDGLAIATINFQVTGVCQGIPGVTSYARVSFGRDPSPSFSRNGWPVRGVVVDGFILLYEGVRADCNGDSYINASDLSFLVREIFDGDGNLPINVPTPPYVGDPVGCNPNFDALVDAGDLSCTVKVIFYGSAISCSAPSMPLMLEDGPLAAPQGSILLSLPDRYLAGKGEKAYVPVKLDIGDNLVSSLIFSVDYDQTWLAFDQVIWNIPDGYTAWYDHSAADVDGELDFSVYGNSYTGASPLTDGAIATIVFDVGSPDGEFVAQIVESVDPTASFGGASGNSLDGSFEDGSVWISDWLRVFLPITIK
ncbi:MAG: hypothetical protein JXA78_02955 [Anaerolineales bacterium]|nr:hypothetical protein [Anaerolineales bacterium]